MGCICVPAPSRGGGEEGGAGEKLGPISLRAVTWAGTGFQTFKPQSAQSLLIPGLGERLVPAGEGLLWGSGEVWRGACRDRLEAAGPGLSPQGQGPVSCPPAASPLLLSILYYRSSMNSYPTRLLYTSRGGLNSESNPAD